jgi:BirA family biotin operon repressor/biotin-[acetyl-CoA-carboxylase] ligase
LYKILAKTLFIGKKLVFLPSCHSTNEVAGEMLKNGPFEEGIIIITDHQTAGKGQRGNTWETEPNQNLTFSLILKPFFLPAQQQFDLNIAISLGIHDFLKKLQSGFLIKWPNDIYYNNQKLGGVLIQNTLKENKIENSIIGIGLNVNQAEFNLPKATSLRSIVKKEFNLEQTLEDLCHCIEWRYIQLKKGQIAQLKAEYESNLYAIGEERLYKSEQVFRGKITGIAADGRLEIDTNTGYRYFAFKEVEFL